jgi:NAD(P)-dependent dehydrogenase (short-subunit alcohol dehydrogenase family)
MPPTKAWTADEPPNLSGKLIVVTGGNSGIGFQAAREFANKGASVVLASGASRRRGSRLLKSGLLILRRR